MVLVVDPFVVFSEYSFHLVSLLNLKLKRVFNCLMFRYFLILQKLLYAN